MLADEIGRVDAIVKTAEAELKALKEEFKRRGLDCVEGETSTVTASETFQSRIDTARVREFLGARQAIRVARDHDSHPHQANAAPCRAGGGVTLPAEETT